MKPEPPSAGLQPPISQRVGVGGCFKILDTRGLGLAGSPFALIVNRRDHMAQFATGLPCQFDKRKELGRS